MVDVRAKHKLTSGVARAIGWAGTPCPPGSRARTTSPGWRCSWFVAAAHAAPARGRGLENTTSRLLLPLSAFPPRHYDPNTQPEPGASGPAVTASPPDSRARAKGWRSSKQAVAYSQRREGDPMLVLYGHPGACRAETSS